MGGGEEGRGAICYGSEAVVALHASHACSRRRSTGIPARLGSEARWLRSCRCAAQIHRDMPAAGRARIMHVSQRIRRIVLGRCHASPPRGSLEGARDPVAHPTGSAGALVIRVCADPFPRTPLPATRGPRRDEPGRTTYGYGSSSGLLGQDCPRTQFLRPVAVACVAAPRFAELVLFAPVGRRRAWITLRPRLRWCSQRCAWPPTRWPSPAGRRRGGSTPNARRGAPRGACARRASSPRSRR